MAELNQTDALTLLPRLCGTCKHWDGVIDSLGYGTCRAEREPSEAERETLRANNLPDTAEGLAKLLGAWSRTARQDCRGRWWEPESEKTIRRCLPLLGQYAPIARVALAVACEEPLPEPEEVQQMRRDLDELRRMVRSYQAQGPIGGGRHG